MTNFVLVHGTSCGRWIWHSLAPLLRAAGHEVYVPTLTGLVASSHLLPRINRITLDTHIQDVTDTLFFEDLSEVVLVGNSYAGTEITGVAARENRIIRLKSLTWRRCADAILSSWPRGKTYLAENPEF